MVMEESRLLKIALSFSLFGLVVLFFLTNNPKIEESKPEELINLEEDTIVRLRGVITDIEDSGKVMNINIAQPQKIQVMLFKEANLSLQKGDFVEVKGELREYNGKKEIIATQLNLLE